MITPTVGRVLWFWPPNTETYFAHTKTRLVQVEPDQPFMAQVISVYDDFTVNLLVTDHVGTQTAVYAVRLIQPEDDPKFTERLKQMSLGFAEWMPYQKGQARKEDRLAESSSLSRQMQPESNGEPPEK